MTHMKKCKKGTEASRKQSNLPICAWRIEEDYYLKHCYDLDESPHEGLEEIRKHEECV